MQLKAAQEGYGQHKCRGCGHLLKLSLFRQWEEQGQKRIAPRCFKCDRKSGASKPLVREKECRKCWQMIPVTDFPLWTASGGNQYRSVICNSCSVNGVQSGPIKIKRKGYLPPSYVDNKALIEYHKDKPCMDCGVSFDPVCMDFDHRPEEKKLFVIAASASLSRERIEQEIAKCDVVCSNCHRIRTKRRGYLKAGRARKLPALLPMPSPSAMPSSDCNEALAQAPCSRSPECLSASVQ